MLTTSGRAAGVKNTGASILPEADSSQTSSPCSIPNSTAVRGFISIHVPQTIEVMGSGCSCIQGRLAVFPSPNARDANGCREKGYSADSLSAGGKGSALGRNVRSTVTRALSVASSTQTPLPFSALQKLSMSSAEKLPWLRTSSAPRLRLRYSRKSESGKAAPVLPPHLRARAPAPEPKRARRRDLPPIAARVQEQGQPVCARKPSTRSLPACRDFRPERSASAPPLP